jgi:transglutaminase superfamily protein
MKRLARFVRLSWQEQRLLIESIFFVCVAACAVALLPFPMLKKWSGRKSRPASMRSVSESRVCWSLGAAGRLVPGATCFAEALAAQVMMRRYGHDPVIRVGVRKAGASDLAAHAWVECDGRIVAGGRDSAEKYDAILVF